MSARPREQSVWIVEHWWGGEWVPCDLTNTERDEAREEAKRFTAAAASTAWFLAGVRYRTSLYRRVSTRKAKK